MSQKVQWGSDALPVDRTLDRVLYEIRCSDALDGLLLDSVSEQEVIEDAEGLLTLDALVSPYARLPRKMELLRVVMERTGHDVKPLAVQITQPFKQRGVANVAAIFELSDGQTVSIYFHNPDVTPNKMAPADEVISWKWLLNKRDITIVVAPERGIDLNLRDVARRIMRLAERNSAAFQRVNAKRAERMESIRSLKGEIAELENELDTAQHDLEVAHVAAEDAARARALAAAQAERDEQEVRHAPATDIEASPGESGIDTDEPHEPEQPELDVPNQPHEPGGDGDAAADVSHPNTELTASAEPITLRGNELGDFPDTDEGRTALRAAAKDFLMAMRGEWIECAVLKQSVEIRKRGINETIPFSANPKKLKLIPAIRRLIETAQESVEEPNHKRGSKPDVRRYFLLKNTVALDGETVRVAVLIEEDSNGLLHYDLLVDRAETKTTLDSSSAVLVPERSQDNDSWHPDASNIDSQGIDVNEAALDSVVEGALVLNLFIDEEENAIASRDEASAVSAKSQVVQPDTEDASSVDAKIPFHKMTPDQQRAAMAAEKSVVSDEQVDQFLAAWGGLTTDYMTAGYRVVGRIVAGAPDAFRVETGKVEAVSPDGMTTTEATADQVDELRDAMRGGQVQVELYRRWGGSVDAAKPIKVLHQATDKFKPFEGKFELPSAPAASDDFDPTTPEQHAGEVDGEAMVEAARRAQAPDVSPEADVPVVVAGNELGDFPDTEEGKVELRAAAREYLRSLRGKLVPCPALGKPVEIRQRGIKETLAFSADPRKLKLIAAIEKIIGAGKNPVREVNHKLGAKPTVDAYYHLESAAVLNGNPLALQLVIEEDKGGTLYYDFLIDRGEAKTKTALDSSSAAFVPQSIPDHNSGDGDENTLADVDSSVKTLDSADDEGGDMVLNLFIVGDEAVDVLPASAAAQADAENALGASDDTATDDDGLSDDPNSPNYRYRDTGYIADSRKEKAANLIFSARKTGQRLRASDIDFDTIEHNPRQAKEMLVKANLFGKTDWQALQDAGMEPAAGFLIDKIYASIAPAPAEDSPGARRDYAIGLESIRDRLQSVKTVAQVLEVVAEIRDELNGTMLRPDEAEQYELLTEQMREMSTQVRALDGSSNAVHQEAQEARSALYTAERALEQRKRRGWSISDEQQRTVDEAKTLADGLWSQFGTIRADVNPKIEALREQITGMSREREALVKAARTRNLVENQTTRSWLTFGERFVKLVHYRSFRGSGSFAGHVTNAKVGKIPDWSWADKERPTAPRDATRQEVNFQLRVADQFERRGGAPVSVNSTQALKDMLGLRDVQSGNWVLKDPNSAKFHVEQTAAAMSDLADMLGIEVSALSLGGRLGMAFGARGTGGKNAARAHYEPVHRVVNLTKMGGGGCLGHELFHAIDNILHELVKEEASGGKNDFVTMNPDLLPPGPIRDAVVELREAMLTGDNRLTERIDFSEQDVRVAHVNVDSPRNALARAIKDAGGAEAAVLAVDAYFGSRSDPRSLKNRKSWRKLAAAFYATPGETSAHLKTGQAVSSFAKEAAILDNGSYGKYWSSHEEMAARGFQSWLEDKLASLDRRNDYLSVYADNQYHVDPLFGTEWKPYPEGDERTRINAAFDRLFGAIAEGQVFEKAASNPALLDAIFGDAEMAGSATALAE
ncbi:LPD1 domain-containing protein [Burkholderia plantarii]|uniref:defense against restriction DarA-related protein n=1 Tax=Burkholderia plantarii TaxID=41899 RepID=UPI0024A217BB|nr:LPD1 domain-containing protein [Burkholderia plantarii]GLZ19464.1 hypothetical protein Bpla01_29940 [Burkholderia plantarii]